MSKKRKSFKPTPIPYRSVYGEPMRYVIVNDDGADRTVSRAECLAAPDASDNPYPQRWFVDEESGLVIRLPRTANGEAQARENMRYIWREKKHEERWADRVLSTIITADADKDESGCGDDIALDLADESEESDIAAVAENKALLDTLYTALAELTREERELLRAAYWQAKTEREIAPMLGLKESASVNKRKKIILEKLRQNDALKKFFD